MYHFPLVVLQSIYGDSAIHLWHGSRAGSPEHTSDRGSPNNGTDTIRYVVSLKYISRSFRFFHSPLSLTIIYFSLRYPLAAALIVFHPTRMYPSAFSFLCLLHTPPRAHRSYSFSHATSVPLASTHLSSDQYSVLLYHYLVLNGPPIPSASLTGFRASSSGAKHGTKTNSIEKKWGSLSERTLRGVMQHHKNRWSRRRRTGRDWGEHRDRPRLSRM